LTPYRFFAFLLVFSGIAAAEPPAVSPNSILEQYTQAASDPQRRLRAATMEMEIEASLPRLKKTGRLHALRRISDLGRITYEALRFEGDNAVKKNVIARYLSAESEASERKDRKESMAVTPANYKFKYKGERDLDGRRAHLFEVKPRKKRVGLYKGELWLDAETCLPLREAGRFVKNPSIFLKRVEFVRDYEVRDGMSIPRQIRSTVSTRLVGKAELLIRYSEPSLESDWQMLPASYPDSGY
jgi:hypothetical protein